MLLEFKRLLLGAPVIAVTSIAHASAAPPMMLFQGRYVAEPGTASKMRRAYAMMRLPGGRFAFYDRYHPQTGPLTLPDAKGRIHALLPYLPPDIVNSAVIAESKVLSRTQVILTPDNEVTSVYVKGEKLDRKSAKKVGLRRYLNVWVKQASVTNAVEPKMIWRGYNGSQMEYEKLSNGRMIVPYGSLQPHARAAPPTGRHKVIIQYSDDGGRSWTESESKLVSPCYTGFNGTNETRPMTGSRGANANRSSDCLPRKVGFGSASR